MKFGNPDMDAIMSLYESGHKTTVIAKALQIPLYRVKAIVSISKTEPDRLRRIAEMKKRGMTDSDIARAEGLSKQYVSRITGVVRPLAGDKRSHLITIDQGLWLRLMERAEEFGLIVDDGVHAGRGSVRKMMEHIALGNLSVLKDRSLD